MRRIGQGLLLALGFGGVIGVTAADLVDGQAPDFALKAVSGKNYRLSEYRGQVVLVTFWASWCGECRSQLEDLSDLYDRYQGSGLEMLAVSLDRERDQVADAARSVGVAFPTLHDAGGIVGEQYAVSRLPFVVLIDRDGTVRDAYTGYNRGDDERYLERARVLLSE